MTLFSCRYILTAAVLLLLVAQPAMAQDEAAQADSSATYVVEDEDLADGEQGITLAQAQARIAAKLRELIEDADGIAVLEALAGIASMTVGWQLNGNVIEFGPKTILARPEARRTEQDQGFVASGVAGLRHGAKQWPRATANSSGWDRAEARPRLHRSRGAALRLPADSARTGTRWC